MALLPRQLVQERKEAQLKTRGSDAMPLKPSPMSMKKPFRSPKISPPAPINEEEEWKREETVETASAPDAPSEDGHQYMRPVQPAGAF